MSWTQLAKDSPFAGPFRAGDEMYIADSGVEYEIYTSAPAAEWATAEQRFETVLQSWREG